MLAWTYNLDKNSTVPTCIHQQSPTHMIKPFSVNVCLGHLVTLHSENISLVLRELC